MLSVWEIKEIGEVLDYFNVSESLDKKIEHVEVVLCYGSRPHKPVRREMRSGQGGHME